jgi:5-methyltetrahydrofolate--homocysteine methyltransferase
MQQLIEKLLKESPVITDGSWGTQLQKRGLARGECPETWNEAHPEKVMEVAQQYVEAGSRIILTNTFGANRFVLGKYGMVDRVRELNMSGVAISKKAAAGSAYVFASMGPCGKLLAMKEVSEEDMYAAFREQALSIRDAGADGIVVETMMDLQEAVLAVKASVGTGLPVVACMVFDSGKNKDRTMMGNTPEAAVEELAKAGAHVIGANCGQGIDGFIPLCRRLKSAGAAHVWMKPNAGLPELVDGKAVYRTAAADFAERVPLLIEAGADFIGGCCGTDAGFIKAIRKVLKK